MAPTGNETEIMVTVLAGFTTLLGACLRYLTNEIKELKATIRQQNDVAAQMNATNAHLAARYPELVDRQAEIWERIIPLLGGDKR